MNLLLNHFDLDVPVALAEEELVGEQGVLPDQGGGQELGVADGELLPRHHRPHTDHGQAEAPAVVTDGLLHIGATRVGEHRGHREDCSHLEKVRSKYEVTEYILS